MHVPARSPGWPGRVAAAIGAAPAGPAGHRLVCLDGYSGAGKSTLTAELADHLAAPLLTLEEIYPGWDGLARTPELARRWIAVPLAAGGTPRWRVWDWEHDRPGRWRELAPAPIVLLEGCGAGARVLARSASLLVWVHAPADQRDQRLRARPDWPGYAPFRDRWSAQEQALAATERTPARADLTLDNTSHP